MLKAIKAEIEVLTGLSKLEAEAKHDLWATIYKKQSYSLNRIVERLEDGVDLTLNKHTNKDGTVWYDFTKESRNSKTDEQLEAEYPALKAAADNLRKAQEQYDLIKGMLDASDA
jgi:hypothetical protein